MTTLRLAQPEPRHVVPAVEAEARMREASLEIEELQIRMHQIAEEVEAAEQRAVSPQREVELPESAQRTLQFVDDLVSTNRERMRDLVSQRYAWVGDHLADAHAEAQAIVGDALDELTVALCDHDAARASHLDDSPVAELIASIALPAPAATGTPSEPTVLTARGVELEPGDGRNAVVAEEDVSPVTRLSDRGGPVAQLAEEVESATSVDGVVDAAVQAVLRALTAPGIDAEPSVAPATASRPAAPGSVLLEGLTDDGTEAVAGVTTPALTPVALTGDGAEALARHMAAPGDERFSQKYEDFWADEKQATESRSKLAPRDVIVSMLVLVAVVVVLLAFIG